MAKLLSGTRIYGNAVIDGGLTSGNISIGNATASTSSTTGALVVTGGIGVGGNIRTDGNIVINSGVTSTSNTTGALVVVGGVGVTGNIFASGIIDITNTTASTSTSTGALIVDGGAGIAGNIFVGGLANIAGNLLVTSSGNITNSLFVGTTATIVGNLSAGNVSTTNVNATNLTATNLTGTLLTTAQTNITSVGNLSSLATSGNITTTQFVVANTGIQGTLITASQPNITSVGNVTTTGMTSSGIVNITNSTQTSGPASGALQVAGGASIGGNLYVSGNLQVAGTQTTFNSNNLNIADSIIYLAAENTGDVLDIGVVGHYVNPTLTHTGLVRDATDATWKLFASVPTEPSNSTLDFTSAVYANLLLGNINISGGVSSTSTATGALRVTGGAGITGNINAGNVIATNLNGTILTASQPNITSLGNLGSLSVGGVTNLFGNLGFGGTGQRITGDFSNGTISNRLAFQDATTNNSTHVTILPNGTSQLSSYQTYNNSNPTNSSYGLFGFVVNTEVSLASAIRGSGTYLPLTFRTRDSERLRIDTNGNVSIGTANVLSYSNLTVAHTTPSTSSTTGALVVSGGAGIAGDLNVGSVGEQKLTVYTAQGNITIGNVTTATQATTDAGITFNGGQLITSGIFTEVNGNILSYGINMAQITTADTTQAGGIFRLDVRSAFRKFVVIRRPSGSTTETEEFEIALDTGFARFNSNVLVGRTATAFSNLTVGHTTTSTSTTTGALQVAGGAGIAGNINAGGTTHIISGNVGIGGTPAGGAYALDVISNSATDVGNFIRAINNNATATSAAGLLAQNGVGVTNQLQVFNNIALLNVSSNHALQIRTSNIERIQVAANGNVVVNVSTQSTSTTTGALTVVGGVGITGNLNVGANVTARIINRVSTTTSTASITPNVEVADMYTVTAQAVDLTINAPVGFAPDGTKLMFRIRDNGTARNITFTGSWLTPIGVIIPSATTANKTVYLGVIYNAGTAAWDCIALSTQT